MTIRKSNTALRTGTISLLCMAWFLPAQVPVQVHGFISQGFFMSRHNNYMMENSRDGSLEYREMGINFQKQLNDRVRAGVQLLSRDIGDYGNNRVDVDWAFGTFEVADYLSISAGRVKNDIGLYGAIQDFDFLRGAAILPATHYSPGQRAITASLDGLRLEGDLFLKKAGSLSYGVSYGRLNTEKMSSDIVPYIRSLGENSFDKFKLTQIIQPSLTYNTPIDGLLIKYSGLHGWGEITGFGPIPSLDLQVNWFAPALQFSRSIVTVDVEGVFWKTYSDLFDVPFMHPVAGLVTIPEVNDTISRFGVYGAVTVRPVQWLSAGAYYQYYDHRSTAHGTQQELADIDRFQNDLALTLGFYYKDNLSFKLEGHLVKGTALIDNHLNTNPKEQWQYGIARVSYNF